MASVEDQVCLITIYMSNKAANNLHSCLAHVINLATQTFISTYSKAPHYSPHNPKSHEPDTSLMTNRDEVGLVHSICVKVCQLVFVTSSCIFKFQQECSSAKWKELYRTVQTEAGVSQPTQLLIGMKVQWSSTYMMLNRAECNKEVYILHHYIIINAYVGYIAC